MPNISLDVFEGTIPRTHPKLLGPNQSQTAENCDLSRGNIRPILDIEYEADTGGLKVIDSDGDQVVDSGADDVITDQTNSIYQLGTNWLGWEGLVSVVKSFIADTDNRIYYTGDGLPKQTNETLATSGDQNTWPTASYRLGIPAPASALTYSIAGAGGSQVARSTGYVYTYVTGWEEESAPSTPTAVFDVETSAEVTEINCAATSAFTGGEYFLISSPSVDFYVWYYVNGAGEVTTISNIGNVASLSGGDYFTLSSPTTDYYAWYFIQGLKEVSTVTCGTAASLTTGDYFTMTAPEGAYYVWYNKDAGGGDPAPGGTGIQVIATTGQTAAQVATATASAIDLIDHFGAAPSGDDCVITNASRGAVANTADGAAATGFGFATTVDGVTDSGTDPAVADHTAIQVTVISGGDAASVTDATGAALDDYVAFHAVSDGASEVEITNNSRGTVTDADNGAASPGFTFTVDTQGSDDVGTDPDVASRSGIRVTLNNDDTNTEVATTTAAVLEATYAFSAESASNKVTVTNETGGACTDATAGDVGFPVTVITQGSTNTVVLSAFVHNTDSDLNIAGFRIYRLSSGTAVAEFTYVTEVDLTLTSGSGAWSASTAYSINNVISYGGYFYISLQNANTNHTPGAAPTWWSLYTYTDSTEDGDLGEVLATEGWDEPPDDMDGLILFVNSILVGFSGNQIYFSVPGYPYAWPDEYALHSPDDIVGIGRVGEYLVVLTNGQPFLITGSDPETMNQIPLPYKQPALAQQGIVSTEVGVIYTCEDGLFLVNQSGGKLLTRDLYTKDQWMDLGPEDIISTFYDGKYYGFFNGTGNGIVINVTEPLRVTTISIANMKILDTYTDGDDLYLLCQNVDTASDDYLEFNVYKWEGATSYLTFTWKSKQFQSQIPFSYAVGRVTADGIITFNLYADESLSHTEDVRNSDLFRLPVDSKKLFEIEVSGDKETDFVAVAISPSDII